VRPRALVLAGLGALLLAGLLGAAAAGRLVVDALWFAHLGYFDVFRRTLEARIGCFLAAFAVAFPLIAAIGLAGTERLRASPVRIVLRPGDGEAITIPELLAPIRHRIPWQLLVTGAAALLALLFAAGQSGSWERYLLWLRGGEFGEVDPIFGRDVGFYVFALPALRALVRGAIAVVVLGVLVALAALWLQGTLDLRRAGAVLPERALRVASLALGLGLLLKGADYWFDRYGLLLEPSGAVYGAGYTSVRVRLPLLGFLSALATVAGLASLANVRRPGWAIPVGAAVAVFGVSVASSVLPDLYQRLRVRPDELRIERPYLEHNIRFTRRAYDLDRIEPRPFPAATVLDASAIERNRETFDNVRLWDPKPLLDSYRQLQVIRLYYDFHDVDIDRYEIDGRVRQVMLGVREIVPELLPPNARTWVNQRLQFTHGFGLVMSPVTEFVGEGLPRLLIQDIPPRSAPGLEVVEPRIYFGERTTDWVVVGTSAEEFDYPKGEENVYTSYAGDGGIWIGSFPRRLLFAWVLRDLNLAISPALGRESRILLRRSIRERISALAPFLRLDDDPYAVLADGRIFWIQDAYTTSDSFPYAEPVRGLGLNYVRNSAKIVVDAYHGRVDFYAADPTDPVLAAWSRIFPGMFRPIDEMPETLRRHVRYPENLFRVQAEMYRAYHMTNPDVFYNKEDLWTFPTETVDGARSVVEPYYVIMRLPGEERSEFLLMQPMTPANRDNMVAWLAARCDGPQYGRLVEYQFPKERLVYGPRQIEARIDQDTVISQQLSLWNQMGSRVIRGNLLVIPVEDSVVYVEPLFLRSEHGQIPELKRVIAAYGDRVAMEPRLEEALRAVFEGLPATPPPEALLSGRPRPPAPGPSELEAARQRYRAALEGLRRGDWLAFGREMEALGRSLAVAPGESEGAPAEASPGARPADAASSVR
jgi:hypothetical protein